MRVRTVGSRHAAAVAMGQWAEGLKSIIPLSIMYASHAKRTQRPGPPSRHYALASHHTRRSRRRCLSCRPRPLESSERAATPPGSVGGMADSPREDRGEIRPSQRLIPKRTQTLSILSVCSLSTVCCLPAPHHRGKIPRKPGPFRPKVLTTRLAVAYR